MALGGVFIVVHAAPAKVHPAHVVPVAYPVAGVQAVQVLNHGQSARGSCKGQGGRKQGHYIWSITEFNLQRRTLGKARQCGTCTFLKVSMSFQESEIAGPTRGEGPTSV